MTIRIALSICILVMYTLPVFAQQDTIYFDSDWNNCTRQKASYYRFKPQKIGDKYYAKDYYMSGIPQMTGFYLDSDAVALKYGHFVYYDSLGRKQEELDLLNDVINGQKKEYVKGMLVSEETYKDEILNGNAIYYEPLTGKIVSKGAYKDDAKIGRWLYYYNAKLVGIENYINGELDGDIIRYDTLGGKVYTSKYKQGKLDGNTIHYYPGSKQVWINSYFKNDSLDGEVHVYFPSGKKRRDEKYEMGVLKSGVCYDESGKEIEYYPMYIPATFGEDIMTYIGNNLEYPKEAKENQVEGKVLVRFSVTESGVVSNVKVVSGIGHGCDEEAIRIISGMHPWRPASVDGMPITSRQTISIVFWIH